MVISIEMSFDETALGFMTDMLKKLGRQRNICQH
jgi:hypothetical protein